MKKRWIVLLTAVMLFAFTAGVVAGPDVQNITASLANDIKITLNGKAWTPMDNGNPMAPIIYNGRTYLPVRAVGEAVGIKVDWDEATRTVILGEAAAPAEEPAAPAEEPAAPAEEPAAPAEEPAAPAEEPAAPAAELAIEPTSVDFNKNAPADIKVNITWGPAKEIKGMVGTALGGAVKIEPKAGEHYVVDGDVLTIKKELTSLLPVPINMVPTGTELTLAITFDQGEKQLVVKVAE